MMFAADNPHPDLRVQLPAGGETLWLTADDGARIRMIRWGGASGGAPSRHVLFAGGKRDFIERHAESLHRLIAAGHGVTAFDWRDQGLSARASVADEQLFLHMRADLRLIVADTATHAGGPVSLTMHSMGGCVFLDLMTSDSTVRAQIARAVLFAPMLGIGRAGIPPWVIARTANWQVGRGNARGYPPGQLPYGPEYRSPARFARLSNDRTRFDEGFSWIDREPGLAAGGATWGWLADGYRAMDRIAAPGALESVDMPILMLLGSDERVVSSTAIRSAMDRLPNATLKIIAGGRHELQQDSDAVQAQIWPEVMAFLA
ncbi:MAG: alpha/beta hydrolase [Pacificimonas sp.]